MASQHCSCAPLLAGVKVKPLAESLWSAVREASLSLGWDFTPALSGPAEKR